MIDNFDDYQEAKDCQTRFGGILLINVDSGGYQVCHDCSENGECKCRSTAYIDKLAPSWDETEPRNYSAFRIRYADDLQGDLLFE